MQQLFFFDFETTGLDSMKCAIQQIAEKVIVDGEVKEDFNIYCSPKCNGESCTPRRDVSDNPDLYTLPSTSVFCSF